MDARTFIEQFHAVTPFRGEARYDEPMARHTTFQVGGPADVWVRPDGDGVPEYAAALLGAARSAGVRVFVLGGGANLVMADAGFRGVVLDMGGWAGCEGDGAAAAAPSALSFRAGTRVDDAVDEAARRGLGGLEFLAGMPGTVGGALWMNARCYGREVADLEPAAEVLEREGAAWTRRTVGFRADDYGYKRGPFQGRDVLILSARFRLREAREEDLRREAAALRADREARGQYRYPSAGSVFKNNPAFGAPSGKIIDEAGLRGLRVGAARVAPWHGNVIINEGAARAADIRALVNVVKERVRATRGVELDLEVIYAGDWGEG